MTYQIVKGHPLYTVKVLALEVGKILSSKSDDSNRNIFGLLEFVKELLCEEEKAD